MKQINSLMTVCLVLVFLLVAAASCKKGDTGPAGAAGPAGPTGATGATGAKGDTGTANVIYSAWLDVPYTLGSDGSTYIASITAAKLDINILSKGEIKVYCNFGLPSNPAVFPMPFTDGGSIIDVYFTTQKINFFANDDFSTFTDPTSGEKAYQYRYILIPGGKAGRTTIDWKNYAEVKKYLNLKD